MSLIRFLKFEGKSTFITARLMCTNEFDSYCIYNIRLICFYSYIFFLIKELNKKFKKYVQHFKFKTVMKVSHIFLAHMAK